MRESSTSGATVAIARASVKSTDYKHRLLLRRLGNRSFRCNRGRDGGPSLDRIEIATVRESVAGTVKVVPGSALPALPAEIGSADVPRDLRTVAHAAWLAAQGPQYALDAYQLVAADAERVAAAGVLADALASGDRMPAKP